MCDIEIWIDIEGYEGMYQVSSRGRVKSLARRCRNYNGVGTRSVKARIMKTPIDSSGYPQVGLTKNGDKNKFRVHELVVCAFGLGRAEYKSTVVDHKDGNKTNNNVLNLQIISYRENSSKDKFRYNSSSKYVGVYKNRHGNFTSSAVMNGKTINLGSFHSEEEARDVYLNFIKTINNG